VLWMIPATLLVAALVALPPARSAFLIGWMVAFARNVRPVRAVAGSRYPARSAVLWFAQGCGWGWMAAAGCP
jgi:hypothetical protein